MSTINVIALICAIILLICVSNIIFFVIGAKYCSKTKIIQIKENQTVTVYEEKREEQYDNEDAIEFMTNQEELDNYERIKASALKRQYGDDDYGV